MNTQNETMNADAAVINDNALQMTAYLEELLTRQIERIRTYDLDGAMKLADESQRLATTVTRQRILAKPEFVDQKNRIQGLYKELCLVIASQRQEVQDKLSQIRLGLKTLGKYSGK